MNDHRIGNVTKPYVFKSLHLYELLIFLLCLMNDALSEIYYISSPAHGLYSVAIIP